MTHQHGSGISFARKKSNAKRSFCVKTTGIIPVRRFYMLFYVDKICRRWPPRAAGAFCTPDILSTFPRLRCVIGGLAVGVVVREGRRRAVSTRRLSIRPRRSPTTRRCQKSAAAENNATAGHSQKYKAPRGVMAEGSGFIVVDDGVWLWQ